MKEIIEMILKEEEEARKKVDKTKIEAEDVIFSAKKESVAIIESTTAQAIKAAAQKSKEAQEEFSSTKNKIIEETRARCVSLKNNRAKDLPSLAQKTFNKIIDIKDL